MATRLFLRDGTPPNDPGETERSVNLPGADVFQDYGISVRRLRPIIGGPGSTQITGSSTANTVETSEFFTSFSSDALSANITAQTWTIAVHVGDGNIQADSFMIPIVYVFREPSTVVGFVIDAHTQIGTNWATAGAGVVATFSGAAVSIVAGDYLVLEFWRHATQGMAMSYTQTLRFNGGDIVTQGSTDANPASYLETPQDGIFDASHEYIPRIKRTVRSRILTR
jgi:hypothetical protein